MAIKKMLHRLIFTLTIIMLTVPVLTAYGAEDVLIERTKILMPEIKVYFHSEGEEGADWKPSDIQGFLGGERLNTERVEDFSKSEGITYFILIDESTSIRNNQLEDIKTALTQFTEALQTADQFVLMTFGETVEVVLDGHEAKGTIQEAIQNLNNKQQGTLFFDAFHKAAVLAMEKDTQYRERKAAICISDAVDYNKGGYTLVEITEELRQAQLPVFAIGLDTGSKDSLDTFGAVARSGNGAVELVQSSVTESFQRVLDRIEDCKVVTFTASTNIASGKTEELILRFSPGGKTIEKNISVIPIDWIPDNTVPQVTGLAQEADNTIHIYIDEEVVNAGNRENYTLTDSAGETVPIEKAVYRIEEDGASVTLTLNGKLYEDKYVLEYRGIHDISMEKNPLEGSAVLQAAGQSLFSKKFGLWFGRLWWIIPLIIIILILLIAYFTVKKRKGLVTVDGKISFGDMVEFKHHFEAPQTKPLCLVVTDVTGNTREVNLNVSGSIFVGRSSICNLYFDDPQLSRQHFAVEAAGEDFIISDLNSINGTFVNGIRLTAKRKLQNGDVINAGQERFVFNLRTA